MAEVRLYRTSGIVLRQRALGETDQIVTLFTREQGKVSAVARGVKRANSKLAAGTQLFAHTAFQVAAGRNLDVVTQCRVLDSHYGIRSDLERVAYASYFCELVDGFTEERAPSERMFQMLLDALGHLERGEPVGAEGKPEPALLARVFELRLLGMLGYAPRLAGCIECNHVPAGKERVGLSAQAGGVVCEDCARGMGRLTPLGPEALRAARICLQAGTAILPSLTLPPRPAHELERACRSMIEYHLDRRVKSARFLEAFGRE